MAICRAPTRPSRSRFAITLVLLCVSLLVSPLQAFVPRAAATSRLLGQHGSAPLFFSAQDPEGDVLSESDQTTLAVVGKFSSVIMSVLFSTGCGLPAGPFGLVGAVEGVSYLATVSLVGYSLYTRVTTGKGLPDGPGKLLWAAEGLAYLALLAGAFVLYSQITNYGFIPNAVPMEGGMCK
ncbi:hypothetical protein THAOC_31013 [Thalassiosira oceanica]|uniref:Uncharacterized protein n=1 Tax=Thalassiosira oceanica TaxID=159749 RepID=K0RMB7_THAOC|nr:hypothetical protein THAOC_31013 [Thalassiosira oceanica]|eukprot:EJK50056.1 hypothetical protein THAOC_31013 [Thalassiosira oceanica]